MPTKTRARPAAAATKEAPDVIERLRLLARKYPRVTESLEFTLEIGILAAQALRQIALGVREGSKVVARRHRAASPAAGTRRRAATAVSKSR
jgi:hypothetical protein